VGLGLYIWSDFTSVPTIIQEEQKNNDTTIIEKDNVKIGIEGNNADGATIKEIPIPNNNKVPAMPNLDRPISTNPEGFSSESTASVKAQIEILVSELKKDPNQYGKWLQLGLNWKLFNDFEGARLSWEYASIIGPDGFVAFYNLGDLYAYYLHNNAKAEENYKKALVKGPNQIYVYRAMYDFYRNVLKNDALAKKTLEEGIVKNPDISKDLKYLLDNYNSL
jgi:tetratricopeptide (TPR) repeat protein